MMSLYHLCREAEDPMTTDACVTIENLGVFASASALHATTENKDIIKPCSAAGSSEPCVKSMITFLTNDLRVVYGNKMGSTISKQEAYNSDSTDCSAIDTNNCQQIWGINKGHFEDVSLTFPADQDPTNMLPLTNTANLLYNNNNSTSINFSIVRDAEDHFDYSFTQDPGQICAFVDGRNWYDCVSRVDPPNLIVSNATGSTYFTPMIRASYTDGNNTTSAIIKPTSVYDAEDTINTEINLAGTMLEAFVTDELYHTKPFLGPNAPNSASIYGIYQDDIKPIDSAGDENEDAVYLKGLEYLNGEYHLGGRYACLSKIGVSDCPDNPEMCVLTNLLNSDVVPCGDFLKKSQEEGINQCTGSETGCTYSDSISKIGSGTIDIKACDDSVKCYDWDVELCATSYDAANRVDPIPDFGSVLPQSKYYDTTAQNYDTDLHIVRNKTSVEQGLCVTITRPTCSSENDYSQENGYASWPETTVEEIATGSCRPGYSSLEPLTRYCIPLDETQSVAFEPLYRVQPDGSFQYPPDLCQPLVCPAETNSAENGHASWTSAAFGSNSIGTCRDQYSAPVPLTRPCVLSADGNSVELGEMSGECTEIEYCTAITNPNTVSNGYATWTSAEVGGQSVGTCATNYYSDATLTRPCELSNGLPTLGDVSAVCSPVMCQGVSSSTTISWPNSFPGVNIAGSCPPGYEGSVSRDCNISSDGKTATYGSVSGTCTPKVCPAEGRDPNASGAANASWQEAEFGTYSRGYCKNGQNYKSGTLQRKCILAPDGVSVQFESIEGKCK
ncbi:MAG: hypothetical protein P8P83_05850 [Rickettsiaceae bacterium]|nr:hypothetical protein [Rickettsiaceae bacterium]